MDQETQPGKGVPPSRQGPLPKNGKPGSAQDENGIIIEANETRIRREAQKALLKELKDVFEKVGRPELFETIQWDVANNAKELSEMLTVLSEKGEDGLKHDCELIISSAGADIERGRVNAEDLQRREALTSIENPFKTEMLKLEKVWQTIKRRRERVVDEEGKEHEIEYLIFEFNLKDALSLDTRGAGLTSRQEELAKAAQKYLQLRYQWDTNIFQDKKFQVIKQLDHKSKMSADLIFAQLGISKKDQYRTEGVSRKKISLQAEKQRITDIGNKGTSLMNMDYVTKVLGIGNILRKKTIVVNGHHGWCGDSTVMSGIVAEAMFKANRDIANGVYAQEYDEAIGITSDNMGIVSIPEENDLYKQIIEDVRRKLDKLRNPNLSDKKFYGFRHPDAKDRALFDPEDYGRDMEWTANQIFGLLGKKEGEPGIKNIWIGWSFGGAATEEFAARILMRLEDNWRRQAPVLLKTLRSRLDELYKKVSYGPLSSNEIKVGREFYNKYTKLYEIIKPFLQSNSPTDLNLPHISQWSDIGHPDIVYLPHASAVNGTCGFLGAQMKDLSSVELTRLAKQALSGAVVTTGIVAEKIGAGRLKPVEKTLDLIAGIYTTAILFTGTITPTESKILDGIGKVHKRNYVSPLNGEKVVGEQTTGLKKYKGRSERANRLLRTKQSPIFHAAGLGDFLVTFRNWSESEATADTDMITTVDDFGHSIVEKTEHKKRLPVKLYTLATREQLYYLNEIWKQLADLHIGFNDISPSNRTDFLNATSEELINRFDQDAWSRVIRTLPDDVKNQRIALYNEIAKIFENNSRLETAAMDATIRMEPHLFCPRKLTPNDNRGALTAVDSFLSQIFRPVGSGLLSLGLFG